ncbi:MAG: hypothetical protein WAM09_07210, partial [Anaerolineales bacterium]
MEIIHPSGGYFQKNPLSGEMSGASQSWITRSFLLCGSHPCFRWAPPNLADCGLNSSYSGFVNYTVKIVINFDNVCSDIVEEGDLFRG